MKLLRAGFLPLFQEDFYSSTWRLTHKCNFACSYCCNSLERKAGLELPRETMLNTLKNLRCVNKASYHFTLEGGEVTLYPHLEEMLLEINRLFMDKKPVIRLLSNGSASALKMRSLLQAAAPANTMFIISLHLEYVDMQRIVESLCSFSSSERKKHFLLKLIVVPGKENQALEAKKLLDSAGITNYRILHVLDFDEGVIVPSYTQEQLDFIAALKKEQPVKDYFQFFNEYENGNEHAIKNFTYTKGMEQNLLHYKGMYCCAGYASFQIEPSGKIRRARCYEEMPYTVEEKNPFADPDFITPLRCHSEHCACVSYIKLPKWVNSDFAPNYLK